MVSKLIPSDRSFNQPVPEPVFFVHYFYIHVQSVQDSWDNKQGSLYELKAPWTNSYILIHFPPLWLTYLQSIKLSQSRGPCHKQILANVSWLDVVSHVTTSFNL